MEDSKGLVGKLKYRVKGKSDLIRSYISTFGSRAALTASVFRYMEGNALDSGLNLGASIFLGAFAYYDGRKARRSEESSSS